MRRKEHETELERLGTEGTDPGNPDIRGGDAGVHRDRGGRPGGCELDRGTERWRHGFCDGLAAGAGGTAGGNAGRKVKRREKEKKDGVVGFYPDCSFSLLGDLDIMKIQRKNKARDISNGI